MTLAKLTLAGAIRKRQWVAASSEALCCWRILRASSLCYHVRCMGSLGDAPGEVSFLDRGNHAAHVLRWMRLVMFPKGQQQWAGRWVAQAIS